MPNTHNTPLNFPQWIEAIAAMGGFKLEKLSETLVAIRYKLHTGRYQTVWISPAGKDPLGNTIITISSPAMKMGAGYLLDRKQANQLLRQNAKLMHGAWAIANIEGDDFLILFDTQIAETMDTKELTASIKSTAFLADEMERELKGTDKF